MKRIILDHIVDERIDSQNNQAPGEQIPGQIVDEG